MANTIADTLKKLGAVLLDKMVVPLGIVDDDPPAYADGDSKPFLIHKTSRGVVVWLANATGTTPDMAFPFRITAKSKTLEGAPRNIKYSYTVDER